MEKLFIIDGNSLINRAFYALPLLTNSNGVYSNAVFGFVNCLTKLITEENPTHIVVAFDHARKTFRNNIFEAYKGTRKATPPELLSQFPILKEVLNAMGIKYIEQEGIEADDIIGTISKISGVNNYIITGDRDCLQLITNTTSVWLTHKGITDIKEVNLNNIQQQYGLTPEQIIEFKALAGDSSDNIPGIAGIGEKTAISLLNQYQNVDNIFANIQNLKGKQKEKIEQGKDMCYISKTLATIKTDCNISFNLNNCTYEFPFNSKTKELFERYEFNSLLKRESLFCEKKSDEVCFNNIEIVDELTFKNLISNFSENVFCFYVDNGFNFSINNKNYCINSVACKNNLFEFVKNQIDYILQDNKITKIVSDLKETMHAFKTSKISNVFDLSLASYLISGGNKPEKFNSCCDFNNIHQNQQQKLIDLDLNDLYYNIELPLVYVLFDMENDGIKMHKEELSVLKERYQEEVKNLEMQIKSYTTNKNININSPKQVSQFLFEELKLTDRYNKKHSTSNDCLIGLTNEHPVVSLILRYRKVAKILSTYVEPYQKILSNSPDSILHTIYNQTQTATGRLSSKEPNLQNIPVRDEEGKSLRKMFVSRFDGGTLISSDYNQIELRLLANFSNDQVLISDYNKGADIHKVTASQIFNVELNNVTETMRRYAKAVNFGIIYGMSSFGLARNVDISVKQAKEYIEIYFQKYPCVKEYLNNLVESAKNLGYAKTLFGRIRYIPELKSGNGLQKMMGERIAMNMPLQGSASDIIKKAMINVHKRFKNENINSKLILQIHDELIVDTYPGEEGKVKQILKEEMQNVYQFQVPLLVSINCGKTWYSC